MSDNERKINRHDIAAYENMDNTLHSLIVGVKQPSSVFRYQSPNKWTTQRTSNAEIKPSQTKEAINPNTELIKLLNPNLQFLRKNAQSETLPTVLSGTQPISHLAEIVAKKFEEPINIHRNIHKLNGLKTNNYAIRREESHNNNSLDHGRPQAMNTNKNYAGLTFIENKTIEAPDSNKSFLEVGKTVVAKEENSHDTLSHSVEPVPRYKVETKELKPIEFKEQITNAKMKAAGKLRRQLINYNIITGIKTERKELLK